jgi:hypothetical protein
MLTWCTILFVLGVLAFLDAMFSPPYGDVFRKVNSLLFMLISLGMLIRLRVERLQHKAKSSNREIERMEKKETSAPRLSGDDDSATSLDAAQDKSPAIPEQGRKEPSRTVGVQN